MYVWFRIVVLCGDVFLGSEIGIVYEGGEWMRGARKGCCETISRRGRLSFPFYSKYLFTKLKKKKKERILVTCSSL